MYHALRQVVAVMMAGLALVAAASGTDEGHCDNPQVRPTALARSVACTGDLRTSAKPPVLLIAGTYLDPGWFAWNYVPALARMGWPVCTVALPRHGTAPIQVSAEYIAYAIRAAYRQSGRRVRIIGFSQGGMDPRWVLRFAPETRHKVAELISLAASNHGAVIATQFCDDAPAPDSRGTVGCPAAMWQQRPQSAFLAALNAGFETVRQVDYTAIYSREDEVIGLNGGRRPSSALRGGSGHVTNIALQDLCPANGALHLDTGSFDPVAFAVVIDALRHRGPASRARLLRGGQPGTPSFCAAAFMPGVNPATFEEDFGNALSVLGAAIQGARNTRREPDLPCYTQDD